MAWKYVNENEIKEYDITLKIEVLLELIAGTQADIGRYMQENLRSKKYKNNRRNYYWKIN